MKQTFTVSQVNSYIKRIFESDFALRRMVVMGEASNVKYHSSGHIYFSLKDEKSVIRCVMFSSDRKTGLGFRLENGHQIVVSGRITVFERDGSYQIYVREIKAAGAGELYIRYEQLKAELAELGYFDFERKKELPPYPRKIGIVTAATGAAIHDISSVAKRRNPYIDLYLYPAKVQGAGAAETIAAGIRYFDRSDVDIIIIGRGGGSMEDLWAFNERIVADAIYNADKPIISGTGHEVDMTIADYCADVRAATPTAACELAIFDYYDFMHRLDSIREAMERHLHYKVSSSRTRISDYKRTITALHPGRILERQKTKTLNYKEQLDGIMNLKLRTVRHRYDLYLNMLHGLSPTERLKGGFVYVFDEEDRPLISVEQINMDKPLYMMLKDGTVKADPVEIVKKQQGEF